MDKKVATKFGINVATYYLCVATKKITMREIKFRAFVRGYMVDVKSIDFENNYLTWFDGQYDRCLPPNKCYEIESLEDAKIMRFTGRHDKNGKKIYEFDVVKSNNGNIGVIKVGNGGEWWMYYDLINNPHAATKESTPKIHSLWEITDRVEVVGNIYENPELIKTDNK